MAAMLLILAGGLGVSPETLLEGLCVPRGRRAPTHSKSGRVSHAKLWQALGDDISCGVAGHSPGKPATQVLCSGSGIPAPKQGVGFGDPGFVFLGARGRPILARLSQDSFAGSSPVTLASGRTWSELGVTCKISETTVRCANRSAHGFSIGKGSYKAF
jgi:hypothetical protein